ncbi:type I-E CRISPR-associated protein Cas5/CasD [Streptomyces sp. NBC_00536]|uniref:type I-E CRISPR-associated protein Cas5/CasD n=1 Tax=Streptomyces sp. NBC_00536 TaxID=2975769 RepID=UPI002E809318|nr:type I-E CRISPR-associated protein Cas5/CasD [Streptomyces sp. NBC_00536]WUC83433.1 type I-E CRISPR-associated protein Cas5/CasD [Streptomyces sp. NBC_00536]
MTGLLLRLAGPLQSWGERSVFSAVRDTARFPTRSGIIGILAAAQGLARGDSLARYDDLEFTIRIDRPGILLSDFHTVGGGLPTHLTAATSGGKNKGDAVITRRHYLADAVFVAAVSGHEDQIEQLARALQYPHWAPYLGRRSCLPDEPFLLRSAVADPVAELLTAVPLSSPYTDERRPSRASQHAPRVEFLWEQPPTDEREAVRLTINDHPVTFAPHARSHAKRHLYRTVEELPVQLLETNQRTLHQRLIDYATGSAPNTESTEIPA